METRSIAHISSIIYHCVLLVRLLFPFFLFCSGVVGQLQSGSSSSVNVSGSSGGVSGVSGGVAAPPFPSRLYAHVLELSVSEKREAALLELSKKREDFADLAPILWHSFGTIAALLQEIVAIYPLLAPPRLTPGQLHPPAPTMTQKQRATES